MILRRSRFVHQVPIGEDRVLLIHAVSHLRFLVHRDVADIISYFDEPRQMPENFSGPALMACITSLLERGILTEMDAAAELAEIAASLGPSYGRDPGELLERYRRKAKEGPEPYWATGAAQGLEDLGQTGRRVEVVLFGDCDIQMEADFLRREGRRRGLDLRVAATFPDDVGFAGEHQHDVILIGALRARHAIVTGPRFDPNAPPHAAYTLAADQLLKALRKRTSAPILIDNLPEPTVQPLGLAERGAEGHRNRFRLANTALAQLAEGFRDVHVVDVAASLAAIGTERMLDDGYVGFTHFGSPGWMLQRPESEKAAVHGLFPDLAPLAQQVEGDPYGRETAMAKIHVDAIMVALGLERKKCVILDLDGVLWPGVLAETGSPFAWSPETSGPFSYIGLYFGLHEALRCLKRRGVLLACVSKNDEAMVRELWTYPEHYPRERLLAPEDFVTWRVNWNDKVENIRSIADELGFPLDAFLFIDDHPIERDRVRQRLPHVEVWGEDPFGLRRKLLTDPRLQLPRITEESAARTDLVKAQLSRQQIRAETLNEQDYLASLNVECRIRRLEPGDGLERVEELFQRTTQFNTTGRKFTLAELNALLARPAAGLFTLHVADRFGEHGLVGAIVVAEGEIIGLAISCRVLGLGVEHTFLRHVVEALRSEHAGLAARILETARNIPVRNLYRDNGFTRGADGLWRLRLQGEASPAPDVPSRVGDAVR